jgi:hypothetical protein
MTMTPGLVGGYDVSLGSAEAGVPAATHSVSKILARPSTRRVDLAARASSPAHSQSEEGNEHNILLS